MKKAPGARVFKIPVVRRGPNRKQPPRATNHKETTVSSEKKPMDGFRVLSLKASNVKRLKTINITPDPNSPLVIIGGNNGEGKSSAIDCISYALGGKDAVCADPIRHGQTKAWTEIDLGDYIAKRRFTPAGQILEVRTKDGMGIGSPQTILDGLCGLLTFDPLEFSRMNPRRRFDTLRGLVKLDVDLPALEAERKTIFDQRTEMARRHRDYLGQLRQSDEPDASLPSEKVNIGSLVAEKNVLVEQQRANDQKRRDHQHMASQLEAAQQAISTTDQRIAELERQVSELRRQREHQVETIEALRGTHRAIAIEIDALVDPDTTEIDAKIAEASSINVRIERAADYRKRAGELTKMQTEIEAKTEKIEALDAKKQKALAQATFPIDGLMFADGDVTYNGILFDQLSSAEQVRVSLAMAMAMNPKLRVIMIKDGSLLDETSLGIIREMAENNGFQIWIEVVGNRADATVIIEDGAIVGAEQETE